jgi:hypothetical protein
MINLQKTLFKVTLTHEPSVPQQKFHDTLKQFQHSRIQQQFIQCGNGSQISFSTDFVISLACTPLSDTEAWASSTSIPHPHNLFS